MKKAVGFTLLLLAAMGSKVSAQEAPVVRSGDPQVDGGRLRPGRWAMMVQITPQSGAAIVLESEHELSKTVHEGQPAWRYVATMKSARGSMTDTSIVLQDGLRAVLHMGHNPTRTLALKFDGRRITGAYARTGAAPVAIDTETEVPLFDSTIDDLVLVALPLAVGYRRRVPSYVYESGGAVWREIEVTRELEATTPAGSVAAYEVIVRSADFTSTYTIAKDTREVLTVTAQRGAQKYVVARK
ncbi:MAG TPA: hypothetical protein VK864_00630 [Longimicrobiales bacterium]|nr:hypothetical protein [Longimicrobiales bacterium]